MTPPARALLSPARMITARGDAAPADPAGGNNQLGDVRMVTAGVRVGIVMGSDSDWPIMEEAGKVGIGRFVMRNKQYTAAIRAEQGRLIMSTLAYADEVVDPANIDELQGLDDVDVSKKEVAMAESLVDSLTAAFEPEKYHDEYREQVRGLIDMKAEGQEFTALESPVDKPKVVDLMAALEASVAKAKEARGAEASSRRPRCCARRAAARTTATISLSATTYNGNAALWRRAAESEARS